MAMPRSAPPPSPRGRWTALTTVLTMLAAALAFVVLMLAPATPPVSSDELSGAIEHLTGDAPSAPAAPLPHAAHGR